MGNCIVYVKTDSNGYITEVNSSSFLPDTTGWVEIDRGTGDRYHLAQGNYFDKPIITEGGAYRYKLVGKKAMECTPEEIDAQEAALEPESVAPADNMAVWDELDAAYQRGVNSL